MSVQDELDVQSGLLGQHKARARGGPPGLVQFDQALPLVVQLQVVQALREAQLLLCDLLWSACTRRADPSNRRCLPTRSKLTEGFERLLSATTTSGKIR